MVQHSVIGTISGVYKDNVKVECVEGYVIENSCKENYLCDIIYTTSCKDDATWNASNTCLGKFKENMSFFSYRMAI